MENTEIRCLNQLEASHVQQTAALLVDSFYSMFKGITKERELLQRLFTPCMQLDALKGGPGNRPDRSLGFQEKGHRDE